MNSREKLYATYVSSHTSHLYGETTLESIKNQFPAWNWYYGRFLPEDFNDKILEMGCGNGGFVYWLQGFGYENTWGLDISEEQIKVAKRLGIKNIIHGNLKDFLQNKSDIYNIVFARDVIEHFKKDETMEILELVYKALKKDGKFVIQTPNGESPFGSRYRYCDFTHELAFTRSSLNQVLRGVGFNDVKFYPTGPVPKGFKSPSDIFSGRE